MCYMVPFGDIKQILIDANGRHMRKQKNTYWIFNNVL